MRRRRRAERLSRLPMRVARGPAPRLWQGPKAKGGKQPAVDISGVDPGRPGRVALLVAARMVRATHSDKKSRGLKRARSKISAVQYPAPFLQHQQQQQTQPLDQSLLKARCLSASVRHIGRGFNDIGIRHATVRLLSFHPFISSATGRACPFHDESNLRLIPHDGRLACRAISCG